MTQLLLLVLGLLLAYLISVFVYWQTFTVKVDINNLRYQNKRPVLPEHIFDIWFLAGFFSLIGGRLMYILTHWSDYSEIGWSVVPWVRDSVEETTIWLVKFPWAFLKLFEGVDLSGFLLCFFLIAVISIWRMGVSFRRLIISSSAGLTAFVVSVQLLTLFIAVEGFTKVSTLEIGFLDFIKSSVTFLIGLTLSIVYLLVNRYYVQNRKFVLNDVLAFKMNIVAFSTYFSVILFLIRYTLATGSGLVYIAVIPFFVGILIALFGNVEEISRPGAR